MATDSPLGIAQVRASLLEYRQTADKRRGSYPAELRERACRCAHRMRASGRTITQIAAELGVAAATASSWSRGAKADAPSGEPLSFVPVVVEGQTQAEPEGSGTRFEIAFPSGVVLRVEGAVSQAITAAIAALTQRQQ